MKIRFPSDYLALNHVYGYPYEMEGNDVIIDFKDVFSEQNKSVLIKFDVRKKIDRKLEFENELSYEDVTLNLNTVKETNISSIEPAGNKTEFDKGYNDNVRQNIAIFEANEIMEQALKDADDGNYESARRKLLEGKGYMNEQMNQVAPSPEMKRQMETMDKYGDELNSAETKSDEEKKEMQKSGKYDNYNSRKKNQ
jgi:hypothetical protein